MSKSKVSTIIRTALWRTYNFKCFYCRREINWDNLEIDHLIPEAIYSNGDLKEIIEKYGLDDDFEVNGLYNLVPSHSGCNNRKSNALFEKETILFYLGLTKQKLQKIEKEIKKLEQNRKKSVIASKIKLSIELGLISSKEMEEYLFQAKEKEWFETPIKLENKVEFVDGFFDIFYKGYDCSELYDKNLLIHSDKDYVLLINESGDKRKIRTLSEWRDLTEKDYFPATNTDIKLSFSFTYLDSLIESLSKAKMPRHSFLNDNITNELSKISVSVLPLAPKYNHEVPISIQDWVDKGLIEVFGDEKRGLSLEYEGMSTYFREGFRADFSGKGFEEIFVWGWSNAIGGTLGYGFTDTFIRESEKELLREKR